MLFSPDKYIPAFRGRTVVQKKIDTRILEVIYIEEKHPMKTHYDKKADAMYISFQKKNEKVARTVKLQNFLLVDLNEKGKILGIEIIEASSHIPMQKPSLKTKKHNGAKGQPR